MEPIDFIEVKTLHSDEEVSQYARLGWRHLRNYTTISYIHQASVDEALHIVMCWPRELGEPKHPEKPKDDADELPW